jgi:hypothetical protein
MEHQEHFPIRVRFVTPELAKPDMTRGSANYTWASHYPLATKHGNDKFLHKWGYIIILKEIPYK